jgi:hypothetical protein
VSAEAKSGIQSEDAKPSVNFDAWGDEEAARSTDRNVEGTAAPQAGTPDANNTEEAKETKANADLAAALGEQTLRDGMHNESVRSLQSALNSQLGKELETDGKFGPNTRAAVREFQEQNGLEVDGVVGPKTREALTGGATRQEAAQPENPVDLPENVPLPTPRPDDLPAPPNAQSPNAGQEMSFGEKLSSEQKSAINEMVTDLKERGFDVKADDIANFMAVETAGTFSPSIRAGGKRNGAVGLAQFTGIAIEDLNRSRAADDQLSKNRLAEMNFTEQSKVVTDYLSTALGRKNMEGREIGAADLYTAVFSPAAIGKPMDATIYSQTGSARNYRANRSLDTNRDGRITKAELTARLDDWTRRGEELRG